MYEKNKKNKSHLPFSIFIGRKNFQLRIAYEFRNYLYGRDACVCGFMNLADQFIVRFTSHVNHAPSPFREHLS